MGLFGSRDQHTPTADAGPALHAVLGTPLDGPFPEPLQVAVFGLGCFWGAERLFWETPGVFSTAAGYAGGTASHPTYEQVCGGRTGHAEVVRVVFDPAQISYGALLAIFWENHDPTQGMRQGNDVGSQYRSVILTTNDEQLHQAQASAKAYAESLAAAGYGSITTEIEPLGEFFLAEDYHQQYLHKVPNGYCPVHSTGVACNLPATPVAAFRDRRVEDFDEHLGVPHRRIVISRVSSLRDVAASLVAIVLALVPVGADGVAGLRDPAATLPTSGSGRATRKCSSLRALADLRRAPASRTPGRESPIRRSVTVAVVAGAARRVARGSA